MGRIKYLVQRIIKMDKKAMLRKVSSIHKKTVKSRIYLFFDMIKCGRKYGAGYISYKS